MNRDGETISERRGLFYGWVIVLLAFMAITTYGLFSSYSVFLQHIEADLQVSRAAVSAAYSIFVAVYGLCAIPMGRLSDRYGARKTLMLAALLIGTGIALSGSVSSIWQLYLFFGVIAGLGHGAIFVVPTSVLNRWFVKRKGLVVGAAISGLGVGLLVVPPVASLLISLYGWREALVFLGLAFLVIDGVAGFFMVSRPQDKGLRPYGEDATAERRPATGMPVAGVLKTGVFWMLYLICLFAFAAEQMVLVHAVPFSRTLGISATAASLGISFLGIGTIVGRIAAGAVSDRIGRAATLVLCCAVEAVAIFLLLAVNSEQSLYLTMLALGLGYGGWVVLCSLMLAEFFGEKNLGLIIGIWFSSGVPSSLLGPFLGGVVFDATRSYSLAFLIAGAVSVLAVVLAVLVTPLHRRAVKNKTSEPVNK